MALGGPTPAQEDVYKRQLIITDLTQLINGLLEQAQLTPEAVKLVSIAGNTTMIHLLAGIDPGSMGAAPYLPAFSGALRLSLIHILRIVGNQQQ